MNPAWNARKRRAYARECLAATTGPLDAPEHVCGILCTLTRGTLYTLGGLAALGGGYVAGVIVTVLAGGI